MDEVSPAKVRLVMGSFSPSKRKKIVKEYQEDIARRYSLTWEELIPEIEDEIDMDYNEEEFEQLEEDEYKQSVRILKKVFRDKKPTVDDFCFGMLCVEAVREWE